MLFVSVRDEEGQERPVRGRVAEMVSWLLEREQELNGLYQGNVQFHFKGDKLTPSKQELGMSIKAPWPVQN